MKKDYPDYPDEEELKVIREWDAIHDPVGLIEYIGELWWTHWGFKFFKEGNTLELHTGGWPGNESLIEALEQNDHLFWTAYWNISTRGGHYYFNCDMVADDMKWSKK